MESVLIREPVQRGTYTVKEIATILGISENAAYPNDLLKSIDGKIVALKADVLRSEYQIATHQILLVNGGFGANANSRASAIFVTNLYSKEQYRVERRDVLGEIQPYHLLHWAMEKSTHIKEREKNRSQLEKQPLP